MNFGIEKTPKEMMLLLGDRIRQLRKKQKMSREELAERSGVSTSTLRKFEKTGIISLESLLKLTNTLGRLEEFETLLVPDDLESKRYLFDD
jgi:transcriptional regulator with XRE-family HTH domain